MALVIITGGARCGKSAAAENLAYSRYLDGKSVTVAVFGNPEGDVEFAERIRTRQKNRPSEFSTFEAYDKQDWLTEIDDDAVLLIDCLGTALSSIMAHTWTRHAAMSDRIDAATDIPNSEEFDALVSRIIERPGDTIVVTNEVGYGLVPEFESGRIFRDLVGYANRRLVAAADASYLCVCGRILELDLLPEAIAWPVD